MRAPSTSRATAHANPTHIYIIGFSDGVVKVGRTSNMRARLQGHKSDAKKREATISEVWCAKHDDARGAEWALRLIGRSNFESVSFEYFRADFGMFVTQVQALFKRWGRELGEVDLEHTTWLSSLRTERTQA